MMILFQGSKGFLNSSKQICCWKVAYLLYLTLGFPIFKKILDGPYHQFFFRRIYASLLDFTRKKNPFID